MLIGYGVGVWGLSNYVKSMCLQCGMCLSFCLIFITNILFDLVEIVARVDWLFYLQAYDWYLPSSTIVF